MIIIKNFKHIKIHVLLAALAVATATTKATTTATHLKIQLLNYGDLEIHHNVHLLLRHKCVIFYGYVNLNL